MPNCLIDPTDDAIPVHAITPDGFAAWLGGQDAATRGWIDAQYFAGKGGKALSLPGPGGALKAYVYVIGGDDGRGGPWGWSALYDALPKGGAFQIQGDLSEADVNDAALGFALASYAFDRYRQSEDEDDDTHDTHTGPFLVWPVGADQASVRGAYGATTLVRDLVNTPASDLGPAELAHAAQDLAEASGAQYSAIVGVDLIREGFPAIYAVGRGAEDSRAPRLVDFSWGRTDAPKVTLVGKGVCFDAGGLDIKSAAGMKIMKKDMGGAAHALGLASMIMAANLDVRLRVLIPAVENSVSDSAMRPLDVVASRKGLSIEIGHTDAEGRVILADALSLACEDQPDLILDFATLTGAARVALGTEVPALFCNDNDLAVDILAAGETTHDPLWRMPLHQPYKKMIRGKVADLRNDTDSPYAGAIMAALFLESFIEDGIPWAHVDLMAWNPSSQPGRPEGGEAMGLRAMFKTLQNRFAD